MKRSVLCTLAGALLLISACSTQSSVPAPTANATGTSSATAAPAASSATIIPAVVGSPAPNFTLNDVAGRTVSLSEYRGKITVLEWINPSCPFVKRHYDSAHIPDLTREAKAAGITWLTIQTTRPDHPQYMTASALQERIHSWNAVPAAILLDADGAVGRQYGAKTTPHIFIINPEGTLVYAGAIDSDPSGAETAPTDYVRLVLADLKAGRPVATSSTQAYGCSVKY